MNVRALPQRLADAVEAHSDLVETADVVNAYEALLPVAGGDKTAAAVLAVGAVLADHLQRIGRP